MQPNWQLPVDDRKVGQVRVYQLNGNVEKELLIQVKGRTAQGTSRIFNILIDTGAQVNLIRPDLFPSEDYVLSAKPISIRTADGSPMMGGAREISLDLLFQAIRRKKRGT